MTDLTGQRPGEPTRTDTSSGGTPEPRNFAEPATDRRRAAPIRSSLASGAKPAGEAQRESLLVAGIETAQAKAVQMQRWASAQRDTAREQIRAHPISSCATVFGVGMIFGLLMGRR